MVFDDVLSDPDALRDVASGLSYPPQPDSNFPGRNSQERVNMPDIDALVEGVVRERLRPMTELSHGKFRLTLASETGRGQVHMDRSHWSGILYLSRPEHCRGGTEFFRHKATNTDGLVMDASQLTSSRWSDAATANREIGALAARDSNRAEAWDTVMRVPMRYNRLLLLRPWQWHTAGPGFGTDFETGRLVYLMFYEQVG